VREIDSL